MKILRIAIAFLLLALPAFTGGMIEADTAAILKLGPFVDDTDFKTLETGLSILQADIQISKNGAAFAQTSDASPTTTHDTDGWYPVPLTATDTDTEGSIVVQLTVTGALPVWWEGTVTPSNVYDSLVLGTDTLAADIIAVSGDTVAADNIEATYDGTGYSDVFAPAQQQQVDSISSGSAAISTIVDSFVLTTGSEGATDFTETFQRDSVYHTITDTAGVIDAYYEIELTGADTPTDVTFFGRANGLADNISISQWNWNTTSWNIRGTISGINQAIDTTHDFRLLDTLIGTGVDIGKVRIRINGTGLSSAAFNVDEVLLGYTRKNETAGYVGWIWIDTVTGVAGTVPFVNGTSDNPVDSLADALTLSNPSSVGIRRFNVAQNSSIQFIQAMDGFLFDGIDYIIDPNGQQVDGTTIIGAVVPSGTFLGNGGSLLLERCKIGDVTFPEVAVVGSAIAGDMVISEIGTYFYDRCASAVAGTDSPSWDFGAAVGNTALNVRHYSGGCEIKNMQAGDTMSLEGAGQLIINANCTGGIVAIRGAFTVTDNASGAVTLSEDARITLSGVDTELTGTHGAGTWQTATGFATPTNVTDAHTLTDADIAALNDFDPASDTVVNVTTVATVTNPVVTDAASRTASQADVSALALEATVAALNNFDPLTEDVTVGTMQTAALTQFVTDDTGETVAVAGSVAQLSQELSGLTVQDIVDGVWDESQSAHTDAGTFGFYLDAQVSVAGTGNGDTAVDHDTGGADTYTVLDSSSDPVGDVNIKAFLKSEYDASNFILRAFTTTADDGTWRTPIYLDSGLTYTLLFEKPNVYGPATAEITIP